MTIMRERERERERESEMKESERQIPLSPGGLFVHT